MNNKVMPQAFTKLIKRYLNFLAFRQCLLNNWDLYASIRTCLYFAILLAQSGGMALPLCEGRIDVVECRPVTHELMKRLMLGS